MAKKKIRPTPKDPKPGYDPNAGTQVGEREYGPALNSVNLFKADQFLKKSNQKIPQFNNTREMMDWLQKFVGHEKPEPGPDTNPFSTLKDNPLMPQLKAGINPYPGTRGYIPPTASSRGAPPPQGPLPIPIPGPMPPGNKIPPFMPPPRLPDPRLPQPSMPSRPSMPSPKIPPSPKPMPLPPMPPSPKQDLPPSVGTPRTVLDANAAAKNAAAAAQQALPRKPAPKPKQVKPTLNSYIPRYERK